MAARGTYTGLIEVATEALFALDPQGVVLSWNRGAERLYGFTAEQAIGQSLGELTLEPAEQTALPAMLAEVRRGPIEVRATRHTRQGDRVHVAAAMSWITTDSGMGYVAVSESDVTYQAEIDEARRVRSELLANMSHELRTPLNSIIGFAELMAKGKVGPMAPEHLEFVGDIATSARRLLGLVNDVLDLARFDAGTIALAPADVDLAQLATELGEVLKAPLAAKELRLAVEISEGCDHVRADPTRLKQALCAFVERAVKVTPARGQIVLRSGPSPSPRELQLEVEAGGPRLAESQLRKVFVEFHQHGGLGLALARRIIEAHGGRAEVESDDRGSTLIAILPR